MKNTRLIEADVVAIGILRILIYSLFWSAAYIATRDFGLKRCLKMNQAETDDHCELGVKGSCVDCDYRAYCNGKWSRRPGQGAIAGVKLKTS